MIRIHRSRKALLALALSLMMGCLIPTESMAAKPEKTEKTTEKATQEDGTRLEAGEKAGNETKGKSLVLERTEGTVEIENAKGKVIDLREGAKLYNGYEITTEEGYAWLSLDDTKLIKLDWYSQATIKKDKKKLEVMLENGSLFCSPYYAVGGSCSGLSQASGRVAAKAMVECIANA